MLSSRWLIRLSQAALLLAVGLLVIVGQRYRQLARDFVRVRSRLGVLNAGDAVPALRTVSVSGDSVFIGEARRGRRQILLFLTKECPFCRATMPAWRTIVQATRDSGQGQVSVVAIAVDSAERMPEYLKSYGIAVPVVALPDRRTRKLFRAAAVPQTVVVGDSGIVLFARTGQIINASARDSVLAIVFRRDSVRKTALR
jgi:thiol-disulfide isomerase/thioredoxin